ncbi:oxidoreductase [Anaerosporomusa subterranea]|uniref:Oxidoreductase n=1 Tax=Anaerosporomusa subterranea TaxID=1794912 RepID=A0A154BV67_ANASB|nr:DoxX family protein [Anaerosporomusa subterranea]KYZ77755.1 oxidoreductase [Anaerosporomusa subterranea]
MLKKQELGILVLRVVLGIVFLAHGMAKFNSGIEKVAGWFASMGLPGFMAYFVATLEVAGGTALIAGLGTRIISFLLATTMIGAIVKVKLAAGLLGSGKASGYELELVLLAMAICLALSGGGEYSLDSLLSKFNSKKNDNKAI